MVELSTSIPLCTTVLLWTFRWDKARNWLSALIVNRSSEHEKWDEDSFIYEADSQNVVKKWRFIFYYFLAMKKKMVWWIWNLLLFSNFGWAKPLVPLIGHWFLQKLWVISQEKINQPKLTTVSFCASSEGWAAADFWLVFFCTMGFLVKLQGKREREEKTFWWQHVNGIGLFPSFRYRVSDSSNGWVGKRRLLFVLGKAWWQSADEDYACFTYIHDQAKTRESFQTLWFIPK